MDKESAKKFIRNAFQNSFDKNDFIYFIKNLLNRYDETKAFHARGYVPEAFKKYIKTYERIGTYIDPEGKKIDILIVYLKSESTVDRARTAQRNFIARYLKERGEKDAGLIAFVSPQGEDWRFSFVKMEYKFEKTPKGDVKVKEEFTPARRYSFLVGKNESSHTAQSCFMPILKNDIYSPKLNEIEEAFSIEKVTKEFFKEYKNLFDMLIKELNNNHSFKIEAAKSNINTENFAKILLGQIIFLYFLQKKGWLGVPANKTWGEGDKCFLRHVFEKSKVESKNFFNDYLEYLFYNTLNNPRSNMVDPSYSPYFKSRIPFLNGGLFEPKYDWENSFMYIDDKIFEKILDVFDLYNFTVKEDEPLDKEVAVDPEMLGKVFENLLEENLRKGKGTYYTPREIVHYMCQESLINYLITESKINEKSIRKLIYWNTIIAKKEIIREKENNINLKNKSLSFWEGDVEQLEKILKEIKVVDPACGSGAFLVSMLQEIVRARRVLRLFIDGKKINEYKLKKETIQNCIYGVDIDPGAIEIAKLRLWLSLIVDYEVEDIEPLPNLDYKIMQGNSLIEELVLGDTSIKLFDIGIVKDQQARKNLFDNRIQEDLFGDFKARHKIVRELTDLYKKYFEITELEEKKKKRAEIDKIEQNLIEKCVKKEIKKLEDENKNIGNYLIPRARITKKDADELSKNISKQAQIMNIFNEYKKSGIKPFFLWKLYFADVFDKKNGFDIVIANPPYISTKGEHSTPKAALKKHYGFADDLYSHFFFRSFEILKPEGILSFITSDTFLTINTKINVRKLLQGRKLIELIKTADVFDAMVSPAITIAQNIQTTDNPSFKFKDAIADFKNPIIYETQIDIFRNAVNFVFFPPTPFNMEFYDKYNLIVKKLYEKWWPKIVTSKKIAENFNILENYRNGLQPGDIALLGTLTEGGQGLATGNNGRFVGVCENTKQAKNIIDSRHKKLFGAVKTKNIPLPIESKEDAKNFLNRKSEKEIIELFDKLKEKYGRDIFGQGYLFRIILDSEIANVDELTEGEKKNGIDKSKPHYVPYDKGDRDGNRWYLETPFVIDWSKEAVKILQTEPKARWQGYDFYFKEGFCWSDINTIYLKCRLKSKSIHDVKSMSLFGLTEKVPEYYIISIMNSTFVSEFVEDFINNTQTFQINDARQLPVIIPNEKQLSEFKDLFDNAVKIKKLQFSNQIIKEEAEEKLNSIQELLDEMVYKLYGLTG
ncbi:MAG: N-6 DNA methylase [Thermodesulfobacteriota bacterium]|nr:N-6 DNA methylase [Thermodesulfobacteriota bacterium]